jgi:hypothetical protein
VSDLAYSDVVPTLVAEFPEWRASYDALVDQQGGEPPGPHVVLHDWFLSNLVIPLLSPLDRGESTDWPRPYVLPERGSAEAEAILRRAFDLFARMWHSTDANVRDLLYATVVPGLLDRNGIEDAARPWFGPELEEVAGRMGKLG